jgi:regulation of enolase protein 1 (concanavalin A-like superfamily)
MEWYNEPPAWSVFDNTIVATSAHGSDFWRKTHYGFIRDNGHFYFQPVPGDFVCEVKIIGQYASLYDQAGLMVRADETTWMKTGIEYVEGVQHVSAVVTRDYSDWSVAPLPENPPALWLRVTRQGGSIEVHYSLDGKQYALLRVTYLAPGPVNVGVMCASPDGPGFTTTFEGFAVHGA